MPQRTLSGAALCLAAASLAAQTVTTVPTGTSVPTENTRAVTGVRIRALTDGTVWFLVPSNDRIVQLQGDTLKQWQIRTDKNIGANPVDFQFDGDVIWILCNGESLIDAGRSILARLDTTTGALREWVLPGSKPAGFWRAPLRPPTATCPAPCYGDVWIPQTDGRLQSFNPNVVNGIDPKTRYRVGGAVNDYKARSSDGTIFTFAYSDVVSGPDGALWMTDFGNNRIVRYEPGADTETSWTFYNPSIGRLNPSQIRFDEDGILWICQRLGGRLDRFDPSNNILTSFGGFSLPIHFEIFQKRLYVSEAPNGNGRVAVLDPNLALPVGTVLTPNTVPVRHLVNPKRALIRDSTITPTTFVSKIDTFPASDLTVSAGAAGSGILFTQFASHNAYGITVADGTVWTGSDGKIVRLQLQTIGSDNDLAVPVAVEKAADAPPQDRVDLTLANRGGSTISGNLLFLYSPASYAANVGFTVNPNSTAVFEDVFHGALSAGFSASGPVRIQITGGTAADLTAAARSVHVREDGAAFGFALPAANAAGGLGSLSAITLFTANRDTETATLGLFTSAGAGAQGVAALVSADGKLRGTLEFNLTNNTLEEHTPVASAFGLTPQAGDTVRIIVSSGSLQAYVRVTDTGTGDTAALLPAVPTQDAVLPYAATGLAQDGTGPVSDLFLENPDPATTVNATVAYFASGPPAAPARASVSLAPGEAKAFPDVLHGLFSVSSGSGSLVITSDAPIASAVRIASRKSDGDYAAFVAGSDGSQSIPAGGSAAASGLQEIPTVRSTDLVLFNRGAASTATVVGFDGNGSEIRHLTAALGAGESRRISAVLHALRLDGPGEIRNARVRVDAPAGSQIYAAFVQTDAVSGDADWTTPR